MSLPAIGDTVAYAVQGGGVHIDTVTDVMDSRRFRVSSGGVFHLYDEGDLWTSRWKEAPMIKYIIQANWQNSATETWKDEEEFDYLNEAIDTANALDYSERDPAPLFRIKRVEEKVVWVRQESESANAAKEVQS